MICKECGYENSDDGQFCSQCGLPLSIGESDIGGEKPARPKLSKKVPYVIPGEETGYIPPLHANDEPELEDFSVDAEPLEENVSTSASGSEEAAVQDEDSQVPEEHPEQSDCIAESSGQDDGNEEDHETEDLSIEDSDAGRDNPEDGCSEMSEEDSSEPAHSDEERPENQETDDHQVSVDRDASESTDSAEGCSDDNQDAIQGTSQMTIPFPSTGMASWDSDFPVSQDTAVMPDPEEIEESFDQSEEAKDDRQVVEEEIDDANEDAADESEDASEETGSEDEEGSVSGKHAKIKSDAGNLDVEDDEPQDISNAETKKLDRVPALDPSSTAVIPSIAVSGPRRYSDSDRDDDGRRISRRALIFAIIAVLAVAFVVAVSVRSCESRPQVPDVIGMNSQEARVRVESAGFEVQVDSVVVQDAEAGTVIESSPKAGARRGEGSAVVLTVAASQVIPDVVGVDLDSATQMLEEQGAESITVKAEASNQPENTVIAVSPETGSGFEASDEIILTVATSATLPDVKGMVEADAVSTLEEAGYKAEIKWVDSEEESGVILATDPEAGELANLGSTVKLEMSSPGPSNLLRVMEYFGATPQDDSGYLQWKGLSVTGSYSYSDEATGVEYVSQVWSAKDGTTVSFTPAPYIEDKGLDMVDYLGQGLQFQGVRLFIPAKSNLSLGTEPAIDTVEKYMEECHLENMTDFCTAADLEYNGQQGSELGIGDGFICAQGEMEGRIWTILITDSGVCIGAGGLECYPNMSPICDAVAVNEILTTLK